MVLFVALSYEAAAALNCSSNIYNIYIIYIYCLVLHIKGHCSVENCILFLALTTETNYISFKIISEHSISQIYFMFMKAIN